MKRLLAILLVATMCLSICTLSSGCKETVSNPSNNTNTDKENNKTPNDEIANFDNDFMEFIEKNISEGDNYMVSPLSFRYAMALVAMGTQGKTQEEILSATGFKTMDEHINWCESINNLVKAFDEDLQSEIDYFEEHVSKYNDNAVAPDRKFQVANSIWHNIAKGKLSESYIENVQSYFNAMSKDLPIGDFKKEVNGWVNEKTNGLIPEILEDDPQPDLNTMLINTLYLKSCWEDAFHKRNTMKKDFETYNGDVVQKEFMYQQSKFDYYENKDTKIVVLPLAGDIEVAFVLGDTKNIYQKLNETSSQEVKVYIPKFEIETNLENLELVRYLKEKGVECAFDSARADFSAMSKDGNMHISDIIQNTKIKVDEDGLEAAAVTTVITKENAVIQPEQPKIYEFNANEPFSFFIYSRNNNNYETLFFGKLNQ